MAELEADKGNPDIAEGDFVLVNTGDVEDPDNAKLYVKAGGDYEFLVDMSGAIGFTGKTPQFSMGTVTTLEAGASATATVSSDGTDEGGNPKYKLNFAIPRGNPGAPFKPVGQYDTLELLKQAIPDGSDVDGMIAVGTEAPYDYYAWLNGEWVSQGKVTGGNVIILPKEILDLTGSSSSEEIFAAFGGIDKFKDLLEKLSTNNYLVQIGEPELGSLRYIYTLVDYAVKLASNKQSGALSLNIYNESRQLRRFHFYLENNGTTARCGEESTFQLVRDTDVLTKTNTSPFTPTGDYQPSTKKYVDDNACKYMNLGSTDLNDLKYTNYSIVAVQSLTANATFERHYPIEEAGILIVSGTINTRTNQIYQTFNSNRIFMRGAGESDFTPWKELASINNVLTKDNTTEYTPTSDYNPAPKAYVDNSISNSRSVGYMMQLTEIDASGLDENTWYPVVMPLGNRNTVRIEVLVGLDSGTKPSWSTHDLGFSVRKIWEVNGLDWGANYSVNRQVFVSDYVFADTDPVRGVNQLSNTSEEYVFVRGGGKYFFYTSHDVKPVLHTGTYTSGASTPQSVSPTTETPAEIVANMATKEYVDNIGYGKVIDVADGSLLTINKIIWDTEAYDHVVKIFGSTDVIKNMIIDICNNHTKYYIHSYSSYRNCIELSSVYAYYTDEERYEIEFNISYYTSQGPVSKRIAIALNLFDDDKSDDRLFIEDILVSYAGYPYPCVGENNLTPITLQQYIDLPYVGDPKNYASNLYFSKYIESFEYRIVAAGIDSGFKVCALNEQVVPGVYGSVTNYGNYATLIGMCNPRYIANETNEKTMLTQFKIDGKLYSYNYIRK